MPPPLLCMLTHLIFSIPLESYYYYPHYTEEELRHRELKCFALYWQMNSLPLGHQLALHYLPS